MDLWNELDVHDRQYAPADGTPMFLALGSIRAIVADYALSYEYVELIAGLDKIVIRKRRERIARERAREQAREKAQTNKAGR